MSHDPEEEAWWENEAAKEDRAAEAEGSLAPASCSEWSPWDADDCPHCGSPAEIRTYAEPGRAYDGDAARCMSCHCPGGIVADGERAWVMWHDELGCDCDWCKTHPPENCQCGHCGTDPQNAETERQKL